MAFELKEYPPSVFREKYKSYLAPEGVLVAPRVVFSGRKIDEDAEEKLKAAFRITIKKLRRLRSACAACGKKKGLSFECEVCKAVKYCNEDCWETRAGTHKLVCQQLKDELIDQMVECLPMPLVPGPDILKGGGGLVKDWNDWFNKHTYLGEMLARKALLVRMWWEYTGLSMPEISAVEASLRRIYSNMFSTSLTVGHCASWFPSLADTRKGREIHIHLLGADKPEVTAVQEGVIQIARRVLGRQLVVTLVAPDLVHHPTAQTWTLDNPHHCGTEVKAVAYPILYHHFWEQYVEGGKGKTKRPDVALAIHPGVHTDAMMTLWRPTLDLLVKERVPLVMTTYNEAEFDETLKKLAPLNLTIVHKGRNPLGSLHAKQTPYEPDHMWAANSFLIAIAN